MGRPNRDFTTDDRFHAFNRAVDGQDLFSIDDDWALFESLIAEACDSHGFRINAYALMSNHYHMLLDLSNCEDRAGVSDGIGVLQSTYAKYFNERTSRRGPLFEPRFSSFGADGDEKVHRVVRYIHRNPIDICGPRALGNYRWSSLPVALGRRESPHWLDCSLFAPLDPAGHLAELTGITASDVLALDGLPPQVHTHLDDLSRALTDLPERSANARERRELYCLLALELRIADVTVVAERLNCSPVTVRNTAAQARTRRREIPSFDGLVERAIRELALAHRCVGKKCLALPTD